MRVIDTNLQGWKAAFQFDGTFQHLLECRIRPEGRDKIENGLCWFKHLPMANDGRTVMAVYLVPVMKFTPISRHGADRLIPGRFRIPV